MRLRIGLHLATNGTLVAEGKATIADVLNNPSKYPVIESNDENMGVDASTANDDFNFGKSLSQALHGGYTPSQAYLDALNVPANGIPTADTDPRLTVLLDPNPDGEYISYDVTKSNQEISNIASEKQKEYAQRTPSIVGAGYYCTLQLMLVLLSTMATITPSVFGLALPRLASLSLRLISWAMACLRTTLRLRKTSLTV